MKLVSLGCFVFMIAASCRQKEDSGNTVSDLGSDAAAVPTELSMGPSYDEVWMMRGWQGHMGMVLGLKDGEFHYWFISDVGLSVMWAKGTYTRSASEVRLRISENPSIEDPPLPKQGAVLGREFVQTDSLYNATWRLVREDSGVFLASTDDLANKRDSGRWLRSVDPSKFAKSFPDGGPFILDMNPEIEGARGN